MHLPAYLLIASLSTRPAPTTRTLNERRQHPRPPLPPQHRGQHRQVAPLPPPIPTLERCSSTSKTDKTDGPLHRRRSVSPHHSALAASSTYSTAAAAQRGSRHLYPPTAAALHPVLAAAAFAHRLRGHHDQLVTTPGLNHNIASARLTMPPGDRPRQPPSVVRAPAGNRGAPLTPKVAGKVAPVLGSLARRPNAPTATNDVASPVSAFLATNVTPRTGHRQTRVDSTGSTPCGTPNPESRIDGWERDSPRPGGLGISATPEGGLKASDIPTESSDSNKFFYASDAKNLHSPGQQRQPPPTLQKGPTFFYANAPPNNGVDRSATSTPQSAPMLSPSNLNAQDPLSTKFFYANGTPDLEPKSAFPSSASNPSLSATRLPPGGRPPLGSSATVVGVVQRPASPLKNNTTPTPVLSPILRSAMSPASPNPLQTSPPSTALNGPDVPRGMRRVSIDAPPKSYRRQSRASGSPGPELQMPPKLTISPNPSDSVSSPPLSPGVLQTSMTMASLLHAAEELQGSEEEGDSFSEPQSPSKSHFSDSVSELVANARRERKVQDLEITNASLEAINRTLERQLRKQTAELRRYRRLSRSGRLSLTSAPNSRVVSAALTDPPVDLSDLSENEETEEEEDEDFEDSIEESDMSMTDTASISAISMGAMRRKRDEKRLQLDLTKHQELLIDSQKMNQSIKRCLGWTEALIKEGQKALEYRVRVSDVEFGGRVLAPVDEDDYDFSFQDVDDHDMTVKEHIPSSPIRAQPDRDSGIELQPGEDGS